VKSVAAGGQGGLSRAGLHAGFLRHIKSELLFREPDQWTSDYAKAQNFRHSAEAMDYAREHGLREVEILLAFDDPQFNVPLRLPTATA
jgi:hypothetical protein